MKTRRRSRRQVPRRKKPLQKTPFVLQKEGENNGVPDHLASTRLKEIQKNNNDEETVLSNGETTLTLKGQYTPEQIVEYQKTVDHVEAIRTKTQGIMKNALAGFSPPYPVSKSLVIKSVPVEIDLGSSSSYAEVHDQTVIIYDKKFSKMSEGFQISVMAHEMWAHYFENEEDYIPEGESVYETELVENPMHDPDLPDAGSNKKYLTAVSVYGSIGTTKEEINGWSLQMYLAENGYIEVTSDEMKRIEDTLQTYKNKLKKMEQMLQDQKEVKDEEDDDK